MQDVQKQAMKIFGRARELCEKYWLYDDEDLAIPEHLQHTVWFLTPSQVIIV